MEVMLNIVVHGQARYLANVEDYTVDGQKCCNWSFTTDPEKASVMSPRGAAIRLPRIRRALGHDGVQVRDAETGRLVRICLECRQALPEDEMREGTDICNDCCWEVNQAVEATLPVDYF
jgi:hypothetical protein